MADYTTAQALADEVGIADAADNTLLSLAVSAASRRVERFCGRRFFQDDSVVAREFYAESSTCVDLLEQPWPDPKVEISTLTGLIVKTDSAGDGTFATTLTINTHFLLLPRNAAADSRPWNQIVAVDASFPRSSYRAGVQVTARWGWATVPDEVEKATLLQAALLFKSKDTPLGAAQLGETTALFQRKAIHPVAADLLTSAGLRIASVG